MRLRTCFLAVVLSAASVVVPLTAPADAQTRECFFIAQRFMCINIAPGGDVTPVADGPGADLGTWSRVAHTANPTGEQTECTDANGNPSTLWILTFYPNDMSQPISTTKYCLEPQVPPPPPTPEEAWSAAAVPEPAINISPSSLGATGIETWLWGASAAGVPVSVSVRGYTVSGVAAPTEWRWSMGATERTSNPPPDLRASVPGSPDQPAARYTYETKGSYTITHHVVWSGTFTVSGWGLAGVALDAGAIIVETSRPYPVAEIRSVRLPSEES